MKPRNTWPAAEDSSYHQASKNPKTPKPPTNPLMKEYKLINHNSRTLQVRCTSLMPGQLLEGAPAFTKSSRRRGCTVVSRRKTSRVGALIIRIGFWGILYFNQGHIIAKWGIRSITIDQIFRLHFIGTWGAQAARPKGRVMERYFEAWGSKMVVARSWMLRYCYSRGGKPSRLRVLRLWSSCLASCWVPGCNGFTRTRTRKLTSQSQATVAEHRLL